MVESGGRGGAAAVRVPRRDFSNSKGKPLLGQGRLSRAERENRGECVKYNVTEGLPKCVATPVVLCAHVEPFDKRRGQTRDDRNFTTIFRNTIILQAEREINISSCYIEGIARESRRVLRTL